jgi:phospho-N-acetylmuramoyl-pentapeptide-transferase
MDTFTITTLSKELIKLCALSGGAFTVAMTLTPMYTYFAYRYRFWKQQRDEATTGEKLEVFVKLHAHKFRRNIPTMAGIVLITSIVLVTLLFNYSKNQTLLPLVALLGGGAVGLLDDIINLRGFGGGAKGLRAPIKFMMITAVAGVTAWYFYTKLGYHIVHIPFIGFYELGWLIIPLFIFVVLATGNAVNISDGLDGLAGGLSAIAFGSFGVIALLQGNIGIAGFCFTVVGALLSYIWFNIYPARFFMGDVGSFALGTSLGVVAMLTDTLFLLPIIGLLFVVEAGSSLIQITSKKLFKRKIFISAPIHHHFEALGWPETKVTMRFWVIAQVMGFIGIMVALMGGSIR